MTTTTPDNMEQARALFFEGLESFGQGRLEEAEDRFSRSLSLLPGRVSTQINLAATLIAMERRDEALPLVETILTVEPDNADALFHRGNIMEAAGRYEDALACFDRVLTTMPDNVVMLMARGQILQRLFRPTEALQSFDAALKADPTLAMAWSRRGSTLRETGRYDDAAESFRKALAHGGDDALNRYYLASVDSSGDASHVQATAPRAYVEALFDDYAAEFDVHLVDVLGYRAHTVLTNGLVNGLASGSVDGLAPTRRRFGNTADLGCGTGLAGAALKSISDRLVGVDLSLRMLEKARTLNVYDDLVHADIVGLLDTSKSTFDLIVAIDVMIYVGDLDPVFRAARAALREGGLFCLSAELSSDEQSTFTLLPSLRYAHSERYVRELAKRHGFEIARMVREPIREDQRESIPGLYVWLKSN